MPGEHGEKGEPGESVMGPQVRVTPHRSVGASLRFIIRLRNTAH